MTGYVLRRLAQAALTVLLITVVTFVVARSAPGGPFGLDDPDQAARIPEEMRAHYRQLYGLDQPLPEQYLHWLRRVLMGDFGLSYTYRNESVAHVLGRTLPVSAAFGLAATLCALVLGLATGVLAAIKRDTPLDHLSRLFTTLGAATPAYVAATLAVLLFTVKLGLLPLTEWHGPRQAALPILILALGPAATISRFARESLLDALSTDWVRTAYAKGLRRRHVIGRHVLRYALLPVVTLVGPLAAHLLSGSFFVETIFNVPGAGAAFVFAAADRDYPLVMAGALLAGALIVGVNLVVDLVYSLLDPRIRVGDRR